VRALLQRVSRAEVRVAEEVVGRCGAGLCILVGIGRDDDAATAERLARRVVDLRIFEDDVGRTNRSLLEVGGGALVVSQFTLYADTRRGRRPGFSDAAPPEVAEALVDRFCAGLTAAGVAVDRGRFGAAMAVELVNEGPFTIWLDTAERSAGGAGETGSTP
jgi:D-tyrosyl-tRNA(Tyr) deacylase